MIVAGVDELVVVELEVVGLVVAVVGEDYLREVEVVDNKYLMKVEVMAEGCVLENSTSFGAYHWINFDYQA